jgi:hypothetical protein
MMHDGSNIAAILVLCLLYENSAIETATPHLDVMNDMTLFRRESL